MTKLSSIPNSQQTGEEIISAMFAKSCSTQQYSEDHPACSGTQGLKGNETESSVDDINIVQNSLHRYNSLLQKTLNTIRLTKMDVTILISITRHAVFEHGKPYDFFGHAKESQKGYREIFEVFGTMYFDVVQKIHQMSLIQKIALTDFCERYWRKLMSNEFEASDDILESWSKLGLNVNE